MQSGESRYEKYIIRNLHIPWHRSLRHITKPALALQHQGGACSPSFRLTWWAVTEPFVMEADTMVHDFDQFLIFLGGDINNMLDLGGEVELTLGEDRDRLETLVFTTATVVYVPAGLFHCPLVFKKVRDPGKPILFQDMYFAPEYKKKVVP